MSFLLINLQRIFQVNYYYLILQIKRLLTYTIKWLKTKNIVQRRNLIVLFIKTKEKCIPDRY